LYALVLIGVSGDLRIQPPQLAAGDNRLELE